ncbi:MAG: carboxypeptidase regulatory-like domain-containing protein [Acidimicrobiia bacterium]
MRISWGSRQQVNDHQMSRGMWKIRRAVAILATVALIPVVAATPPAIAAHDTAGQISGEVRDDLTGDLLADISVELFDATTALPLTDTVTDIDGLYSFPGLDPGDYLLRFSDPADDYLPRWHPVADNALDTTPVTLGPGGNEILFTTLSPARGQISGTVTDTGATPLAGITVKVFDDATGEEVGSDATDAAGMYSIGGFAQGDYVVHFSDESGTYEAAWHSNAAAAHLASPVTIHSGDEHVDAVLAAAGPGVVDDGVGEISGTVTDDSTGNLLAGVDVKFYDSATLALVGSDTTDVNGEYSAVLPTPVDYIIEFEDATAQYLSEFYDSVDAASSSSSVPLVANDALAVDAALVPVASGFFGEVRDDFTFDLLAGIDVRVYDIDTLVEIGSDTTDVDGRYEVTVPAPPGDYVLGFSDPTGAFLAEFDDSVASFGSASRETLQPGQQPVPVDAALQANSPPVAVDDAYGTVEDTQLVVGPHGVLDNDSDVESVILAANLVSGPTEGVLVLDPDGSFTYGPKLGFSGADSFTYEACDWHGLCSQATVTLDVDPVNVAPTIDSITCTVDPVALGSPIQVAATFSDPDAGDTHTVVIEWGDGTSTEIDPASSPLQQTHTFAAAGVYQVGATVTDAEGESGAAICDYLVVVYDPDGGFVTGGGWIDSPEGAYPADPSLTGRASFGFVSKYMKGATTPTGKTQFQFKTATLEFHSHSYEWLVIAGARAQYKGSGQINGTGDYGFMLTAVDGHVNGGGGTDKFRIKIWDKTTEQIVYDNQIGAEDDTEPTTLLGGGSIVIHKR